MSPGAAFDWSGLHREGYGSYSDTSSTDTVTHKSLSLRDANHTAMFQVYLLTLGYKIEVTGIQDANFSLAARAFQAHYSPIRSISEKSSWGKLDMKTFARAEELAGALDAQHDENLEL